MTTVSISRVKLYKACKRAYRLKYIEGLEPVRKSDALQVGTNYHSKIEDIYNLGYCEVSDNSRESAMALAYEKYIYPNFNVRKAEEWIEYDLGEDMKLVGRVDGIADDGRLVEHKTTSLKISDEYLYELQWDEQILAYMLATGAREMWYTVIRKPTIKQKKNESDEDFFTRMCQWYDEDTDEKIRVFLITRTDEEVTAFESELKRIIANIDSDQRLLEHNFDYFFRNTCHCHCWGGRCEYSSICLNYDPNQEYIDFTRRETDGN